MFMRTIGLAAAVAIGAAMSTPAFAADTDPIEKTKLGNLPYTKAPETIGEPTGTKLTGDQVRATFKGRRTVFVGPDEQGIQKYDAQTDAISFERATGPDVEGTWTVKDDQYCVTWAGAAEECYDVYRDSDRGYSLWLENRPMGRVSVH